jgi:hypothetical protein
MPEGATINAMEQRPRKSLLPQFALSVVLLLALALAAYFALKPEREVPAEDWVTHESAEGRFRARFPAEPTLTHREMEGSQDGIQLVTTEMPLRVYSVAYNDYVQNELNTFGADGLLDYAMQAGTEAMQGVITASAEVTLDSHPGREFRADVPGGKAHYRIYLVGLRLYRLAIIHAPGFEANHEEFFGSFTVK